MRRRLLAAALGLSLCIAAPAGAEDGAPTPEEIKRAGDEFDQGKQAYKDEDYSEAASHFESADRLAPSAAALSLAIRARQKAGQLHRAATLAAIAKDRHPEESKLQKMVDDLLDGAARKLHRLTVACDEACDVVIGTRLQHGGALETRSVYLQPGKHEVRAGWSEGRARTKQVDAEAGGESSLDFEAPPVPKAPVAEPEPKPEKKRPAPAKKDPAADSDSSGWSPGVFWTLTGLTVVAGGVTAWSGIDTQNNPGPDVVREKCVGQGENCPEYQDGLDRQRRTNILFGVTGGLAVVTIIVGAALTDWGGGSADDKAARAKRRTAGPGVRPVVRVGQGAFVGAQGTF